jgi:hypothetical protein
MTVKPTWHGYTLGSRSTGYEVVKRARKSYECEGAATDSGAVDEGTTLSPATGSIVHEGWANSCESVIKPGNLYVASKYEGELARDFGEANRYTFRTCLACAKHFSVVELAAK